MATKRAYPKADDPGWLEFIVRETTDSDESAGGGIDEEDTISAIREAYDRGLDPEVLLASLKASQMRPARADGGPLHRKIKILLVDDERGYREMMKTYFERTGRHDLMPVADPDLTMQALESFRPDVAILDVVMPVTPGPELAIAIRHSDRWSDLPVIMLTGLLSDLGRKGLAKEGLLYLAKTVSPKNLIHCIDRCVDCH